MRARFFLYDRRGGLVDCTTHALILVGFWVLFLPSVVLGQAQTPKIQIHTDVENPKALLNFHLQALGESEQEVVSHRLMLSDEQSKANSASEAIGMSRGEPSRRAFFPHPSSLLIPLPDSSTDNSGPSTNASESVGESEFEMGEMHTAVTLLRPFTRLITGEVPLKFEKDMPEWDGKSSFEKESFTHTSPILQNV